MAAYAVEFKDGDGGWTAWLTATTATATTFPGLPQHSYRFRARAIDQVGNLGDWVEAGPVEIKAVTKYYTFGGQWSLGLLARLWYTGKT